MLRVRDVSSGLAEVMSAPITPQGFPGEKGVCNRGARDETVLSVDRCFADVFAALRVSQTSGACGALS